MSKEYTADDGLELLKYLKITLEEREIATFREKWQEFYSDAKPFKNDASHKALLATYCLVTADGCLTRDFMTTLMRELYFDERLQTSGLQERLDQGIPLSIAMQRTESN